MKCIVCGYELQPGTAVCPYCGKSTVIGKSSEYPLDKEFLTKMKEYWEKEGGIKNAH